MATGFLSNPKFQALDSIGAPLSGGKLHTYDPGTTDNRATYPTVADAVAGTNANANPVVLDSRGEADVVLAGNTKLVLKDSDDNTIWTLDNVEPTSDLLDANGNEILQFTSTASAVNELTVTNAATGNDPSITATGDDTNIGIDITPKGSGNVTITNLVAPGFSLATPLSVTASASSSSEIRLPEDTDNGTNYISLKAPAAITSTTTLTLPDGDASTANEYIVSDSSGTLSWSGFSVTEGQLAKGWIKFDGTGTISTSDSYNVSSIVDNGVGDYTVNWDTDFANSDYPFVITHGGGNNTAGIGVTSALVGSIRFVTYAAGSAADIATISVIAFGDQ